MKENPMIRLKQNTLLAFGLFAALQLGVAHAQREHEGHHSENAPQATQSRSQQGGMSQGIGHDKMMQMHDEHMDGHMDHGNMDNGQMNQNMPKGAEQGQQHDY
jgi:hypothetical protein